MSSTNERQAERRRMILLAPLMIAANAFLLFCMVGLGVSTLNGGRGLGLIPLGGDENQQVVADYLAQKVPGYRYRIREWFPATPLEGDLIATADQRSESAPKKGFAQRVKLVFYGPNGARQVDTVYWIQNGRVTRTMAADPGGFAQGI
jgi:hypothetical protein